MPLNQGRHCEHKEAKKPKRLTLDSAVSLNHPVLHKHYC